MAPSPGSTSEPGAGAAPAAPATTTRRVAARAASVDPEVTTASTDPTVLRSDLKPGIREATRVISRVGDEVITTQDIEAAAKERKRAYGIREGQKLSPREENMVDTSVLAELIERSLLYQKVKREVKDPKHLKQLTDVADRVWREEELTPLIRKYNAANEYELAERLKQAGDSLEKRQDDYRRVFVVKNYIHHKLGAKMTVSLPEMLDYYNAHLKAFDRPAQVSWREIVIEVKKQRSRAAARQKTDAILARLRHGEDFAAVAKAESQGPNRKQGGLWETSPGSYGIAAVNTALETLPIGQISQVVEGPSSFHIVRVESRRPEGPAPFAEVHEKVHKLVFTEKSQRETDSFIAKVRSQTPITTIYDGTSKDPSLVVRARGN
jgi:peptidyl-prolyl cis-trans isomerase SurA